MFDNNFEMTTYTGFALFENVTLCNVCWKDAEMLYTVLGLQYVHGSLEDPKTLTHHKLIHAATERVLTDTKTVADESLKDKGT